MNYFVEMWRRLKGPTPSFFKKHRNLGLTLLGLGVFIGSTGDLFVYPKWVLDNAWVLGLAGLLISGQASMVVKDASKLTSGEQGGPREP